MNIASLIIGQNQILLFTHLCCSELFIFKEMRLRKPFRRHDQWRAEIQTTSADQQQAPLYPTPSIPPDDLFSEDEDLVFRFRLRSSRRRLMWTQRRRLLRSHRNNKRRRNSERSTPTALVFDDSHSYANPLKILKGKPGGIILQPKAWELSW